jgi:hypothetical protein
MNLADTYRLKQWRWYTRQAAELIQADGSVPCEACGGPMKEHNITESHSCFHCGCQSEDGLSDWGERMTERKALGVQA